MNSFIKYAKYYNLFYKAKDYRKETAYVDRLIRLFSVRRGKSLLDIGCGTGNHDFWFLKKGYQVTGIDKSREMITIAKDKMQLLPQTEFYVADASWFSLKKKFDVAVSLFHVMSYLTSNDIFIKSLKNIYRHLKVGGLFIFDFWYGPAVLTRKPTLKIKNLSDRDYSIKRIAISKTNINENIVDVCYKIELKNKKNNLKKEITEHHMMRYFFLPELYLMLEVAGFKVIKCLKWMNFKEGLSESSWSGVIIAKK